MNPSPSLPNRSPVVIAMVPCTIRPMDIEAMNYWLNEAPICDPPSQNAVCLALTRMLLPGTKLRIVPGAKGEVATLLIDGKAHSLTPGLTHWYETAVAGHQMKPYRDSIPLPWDVLSRRVQAQLREARLDRARNQLTEPPAEAEYGAAKEAAS